MIVCFAISNYHFKKTGQVKVVQALKDYVSRYHETYIIPETDLINTFRYLRQIKPDIIHSNGYLMSAYIWFINLFIGARQYVIISETFDVVDRFFYGVIALYCLKRVEKVYVTSEYIKWDLESIGVKSIVTRVGL